MKKILVIGNGMVGQKFIEKLVSSGQKDNFQITVLCEEPRAAYDRVQLTSYFSASHADELLLAEPDFYPSNGIKLLTSSVAKEINPDDKTVTTEQGDILEYDQLVLASGSYPFVPPIPGNDRKNCFVYRTIEDLDAIRKASKNSKVGTVIGGGLLGLEAAKALHDLDLETHVVEFAPRLMAVQIDDGAGTVLKSKIESLGVTVHIDKATNEIIDGDNSLHKMKFSCGNNLETDIIVFSAGIRPRDQLAKECKLELGERGGVVVNNYCQTSNTDIYAIGEVALWENRIYGLVAPGYQMAEAAAAHICQLEEAEEKAFTGADMSTKLKLMGIDVASFGDAHGNTPNSRCYTFIDGPNEIYKKIVVDESEQRLLGGILVGDANDYGTLLQMTLLEMDLPEFSDSLIVPQRSGAPIMGAGALPDAAIICSCNNVSKGDLVQCISAGTLTMTGIKNETQASSSCGGCASLCKQILDSEMKKQGLEVNTDLCEHFSCTRQELYHIVRVENIRSFDELIEKHGKGLGCIICKPAAASILASCWNDHILQDQHTPLQDTNDNYLANMQKDGSYSVIPRIPGGEITPDKLIVIGEVAKKYDLYTKITGGQRIDLLGAQVEQLPAIWKELIDAGFESGHAYGKAMRTVKSCVGSTWCRYGMQDSVSMAIKVEERYRGLRSPHKIKLAVSGCTRECAEAQSKDVGVIATENGWNMYVGGNGGMKPRHADLFASDLDDETLIKYIDRFFMFYIRTADRLQRTATWLDNLEGGIDYLREVIIDDKLELASELESEMEQVIDAYQCEWKTAIEDPDKLKRFTHFINDKSSDNNIIYVKERQQKRPATKEEKIPLIRRA